MPKETTAKKLLRLLADELIRRLEDPARRDDMSAAEFAVIRQLTGDASVTLSDIQAGDFGSLAKEVLAEVTEKSKGLPFDVDNMPTVN